MQSNFPLQGSHRRSSTVTKQSWCSLFFAWQKMNTWTGLRGASCPSTVLSEAGNTSTHCGYCKCTVIEESSSSSISCRSLQVPPRLNLLSLWGHHLLCRQNLHRLHHLGDIGFYFVLFFIHVMRSNNVEVGTPKRFHSFSRPLPLPYSLAIQSFVSWKSFSSEVIFPQLQLHVMKDLY